MHEHSHILKKLTPFTYGASGQATLTQGRPLGLWSNHAPAVQYRELGVVWGAGSALVDQCMLGMEMHSPKRGNDVGEHGCVYKSFEDLARARYSIQKAHGIFLRGLGPESPNHQITTKAARAHKQLQVAPFGGPAEAPSSGHGTEPVKLL